MDDSKELDVLFLDIDGVLNSASSAVDYHRRWKNGENVRANGLAKGQFDPMAVSNLLNILEHFPNLKIVVSSVWRFSGYEKVKQDLFFIDPERIIGITPVTEDRHRGTDIGMWLKKNKVRRYVILDDDSDMGWRCIHLIQTRGSDGLIYSDCARVIKRLHGEWEWGRLLYDSTRWWIQHPLKNVFWRLSLWYSRWGRKLSSNQFLKKFRRVKKDSERKEQK